MKLYRAFATVGGLTMLSRVFGFVRDILIASVLGTGAVADAFFVAFRFPNLFRRLFGEGAFNSAFVPLFAKRLEGEGKDAARAFAEEAMAGLVFVILLLTIIAEVAMPFLMYGLAPGFSSIPEKFDLAILLTRITMPYLLCMSLVALLSGVLNSVGKFVESSAVSIVLNLTMMAATLVALGLGLRNDPLAGIVQAWGVFAAGFLQLWLLVDGARRNGLSLRLRRPRMTPDMRRLIRLGIPGVIAGGVTQLNIVIGTVVASLQDGAVSHLYYADRVYELPLAIVGIAIGVVLLPDVSRHLRAGDHAAVHGQPEPQPRVRHAADRAGRGGAGRRARSRSSRACSSAAPSPRPIRRRPPTRLAIFALGLPGFRADQGVPAGLLRARGHGHADALCRPQPDRQHAGLDWPVLPVPPARPDAASGHRRGDHARRLAQCRPALCARWSGAAQFVGDARLRRALPRIVLASLVMGAALWFACCSPWALVWPSERHRSCACSPWRRWLAPASSSMRRRCWSSESSTCASCGVLRAGGAGHPPARP